MKILKLILVVFLQIYSTPTAVSKSAPSVIVVGAGPAGIAATTRLLEHQFKNVVLLEAEPRIGGRVNSVLFGDAYIDMGAEWCHGHNIVYDLVKDFNILGHTNQPTKIYHSSRKHIDFGEELISIMDSIYVPDGQRDQTQGDTVGQYCIQKFNATIHKKYRKNPAKLEVAKSAVDLFHHIVLSSEGAFSWFEPAAENDYRDCEGDLNLNWNGRGYKTALQVLMKKFPDESKQLPFDQTVLLNKEVVRVVYNENATRTAVHVICADDSSYAADHVIFTPSIGVLKNNHQRIFMPSLPLSKQEAINNIGFGAVMKVAMHFRSSWWASDRNFTGFNFIWSDEDRSEVVKEFTAGPVKEGRSWLTEIYSVVPVEHNPRVLIAWLTGDLVPQIELISNDTLIEGLTFVLNKFLGHQFNVTEPDAIVRSSWHSNPHFAGSYSYQTTEARRHEVTAEMELAKPILNIEGRPIVQFAGEASHPHYYSTVHGAIETGHREADRIINSYK